MNVAIVKDREGWIDWPGYDFGVFCPYMSYFTDQGVYSIFYSTALKLFEVEKKHGCRCLSLGVTFSAIQPRRKKEETEQYGAMIKRCCEPTMTLWGDP